MKYRVSISELFDTTPDLFVSDYGGELIAFCFDNISATVWFNEFRNLIIKAIGKKYLPVYRMADGEFQFLLGYKGNFHSPDLFRNVLRYIKYSVLEIFQGPRIRTSWGETYFGTELLELREKYITDLTNLLHSGLLCAYFYENPKNAYVHYNKHFKSFFEKNNMGLTRANFFPFHFPFFLLTHTGWGDFIENRKILIVSGNLESRKCILEQNLIELGARKVGFYEISASKSLKDIILKEKIDNSEEYDLSFVAAGIGSLNIISQMQWFKGPVIDIGGLINALYDKTFKYHGGAVKYPPSNLKSKFSL